MSTTIRGDILEVVQPGEILFHQVNTMGKCGAGLAKQIAEKYPMWERDYKLATPNKRLGSIYGWRSTDSIEIVSLYAQSTIGRDKRHTNYTALARALFRASITYGMLKCYFPFEMSCGLAGGTWAFVHDLIHENFPNAIIVRR